MSIDRVLRPFALLILLSSAPAYATEVLKVTLYGLSGAPLDNVRAYLGIDKSGVRTGLSRTEVREALQSAPGDIAYALEPFGYYRPQIEQELSEPDEPGGEWRVTYRVQAGDPVVISVIDVDFDGNTASDLQAVVDGLDLREGETLNHRRYDAAKQELVRRLRDLGYRDADLLSQRVEVDLVSYQARVLIRVATGRRFVIGSVTFDQDEFDPEYLSRYILLQPGDPYNAASLAEQRRALSRSGYFREVDIEPLAPTIDEPDAIPLLIRVVPLPRNLYRGRLSWGTDTDLGAQLDWTRRYLGGRGQNFRAGVAVVEDRNRVAADVRYVIPLQPLTRSEITLGARHEGKDLNFEDVELDEGGETRIETNLLELDWHLQHRRLWGFDARPVVGLGLLEETYDVFEVLFGNLPKDEQQIIIDVIGRKAFETLTPDFEAVIPKLRLTLRRSDDPLVIRNGDYFDLQLIGSSESLGSNISFWQASLDTWHIRSFTERSRVLFRTNLGYSDAESNEVLGVNFNEMPEYYEFRAGGARSVRGYGFESLVPKDSITGGKGELVGSLEFDYEVIPDWSVAVFVDAGNAFNEWDDYDAKVGTGVGVRWRSPVGLARIDLGIPLDDAEDSFEIYITVGPEF